MTIYDLSSGDDDNDLEDFVNDDGFSNEIDDVFFEEFKLSVEALKEIAEAFSGVDMKSMPHVPPEAPCRSPHADPEDWFNPLRSPDFVGLHPKFLDEIAEMLCDGCPVLDDCRRWALDNPLQEGIMGGLTHRKRLKILDSEI